jgi:hypothetical protein
MGKMTSGRLAGTRTSALPDQCCVFDRLNVSGSIEFRDGPGGRCKAACSTAFHPSDCGGSSKDLKQVQISPMSKVRT